MLVWNLSILGCPLPQKFALPGKMGGVNSRAFLHKYPIKLMKFLVILVEPWSLLKCPLPQGCEWILR